MVPCFWHITSMVAFVGLFSFELGDRAVFLVASAEIRHPWDTGEAARNSVSASGRLAGNPRLSPVGHDHPGWKATACEPPCQPKTLLEACQSGVTRQTYHEGRYRPFRPSQPAVHNVHTIFRCRSSVPRGALCPLSTPECCLRLSSRTP